jgi:YbbR domain-containing protein
VRRITDLLRRNWPLRLGAILLATVLYTGLVLGQNVRTWSGTVPVDPIRPPAGATLLSDPDPVRMIRYRAPLDVGVLSPDSFRATVDLSRVEAVPGGDPVNVPVTVVALDSRVQIVDFEPRQVEVRLDPVEVRQLPVTVSLGSVADGLTVGPPQTEPASVTLRGASSRVNAVSQVVARVSIDASALNVDREVELVAVDGNGNQVSNVEIDPERARVRIAVARELANRTLPVVPVLSGQPAFGYRVSAITVEPLVVTVSGEAATVGRLDSAPTLPISVDGRTTDLEVSIGLALPQGVSVTGSDQVRVTLTIERDTGTRTVQLAVVLNGTTSDRIYVASATQVEVVLAGPIDLLAAINPTALVAVADVSAITSGTQTVSLAVASPAGVDIAAILPDQITVTVTGASPSASPSASP